MDKNTIVNKYFDWMFDIVCNKRFTGKITYRKLLMYLHTIEFYPTNKNDINRVEDGIGLRWEFAVNTGRENQSDWIKECLEGPCSVLEMIVALSIRIEKTIMDNPDFGDRTGQWFWRMITNLGLGDMDDKHFDKKQVNGIISKFIDHQYKATGEGGLFTIRTTNVKLTAVDIWTQACWYLDSIS